MSSSDKILISKEILFYQFIFSVILALDLIPLSDFFNFSHVFRLAVAGYQHVYQGDECPNQKGYWENVIAIKELIESHVIHLNPKYHVDLCVSCISGK